VTDPDPVAALAAQLAELRGQWARSQGEIGVLREQLKTSTSEVAVFRVEVKRLRAELAEAIEARRLKPPPAPWWHVGPEQYQAMRADLAQWVETFLVPHYRDYLVRLPPCLLAHPAAIWEVSTLRAEWERIFADPENGDLQGLLAFHDRWLPGATARLTAALGKCDEMTGCQLTRRYS